MLNSCAGLSNLAKEKRIEVRPAIHASPSPCHATVRLMPASAASARTSPAGRCQKFSPDIELLLRTKTHYCGVLTEQGGQG